jgi:hypothetical protein
MKKRNYAVAAALALLPVLAALVLSAGCEATSPDEMSVTVTPNYAKLKSGQSVALTASGWFSYSWSLSKPDYGYLSSTAGERVTYRAIKANTPPKDSRYISNYNFTENGHIYVETTSITYYNRGEYWEEVTTKSYTGVSDSAPNKLNTSSTKILEIADQLKQIVTVRAVGPSHTSSSSTNASSIAVGQVTILQEE